ncbi:hypothetical protein ACFFHM_24430 [Halalkalibacter kiskunsagensis]|uniref:Cyclase n=1 Tax=Halalkalibacter kiskunsagensis TaxID=1548599 RepID=A0ABV6KKR6_9BACI
MDFLVFTYRTVVKASIDDVWSFFATAENLAQITTFPKINIQSDPETKQGNVIVMKLGLAGFYVKWTSLISEVNAPHYFIDKGIQLPLPFTEWTHKHSFTASGTDTIIEDTVIFKSFVPSLITKPMLVNLFRGRELSIMKEFSSE